MSLNPVCRLKPQLIPPARENRSITVHGLVNGYLQVETLGGFAAKFPAPGRRALAGQAAVLVKDQVQHPADDADNDGPPECWPEASDMERQAEFPGDPAAEPEQEAVDDQPDQPESHNVEQAADGLHDGLQNRVDDTEDQRHEDERAGLRQPAAAGQFYSGYQQVSDAERSSGDQDAQQELHGVILCATNGHNLLRSDSPANSQDV